jgi:aryl-alcohol dehydrogenase-like predicted oxidoreductase
VQSEYSLWTRDPEPEVLPALRELGIGFVPYSPLGRGMLTGRIATEADLAARDYRRTTPRFQGENLERNVKLVARLSEFAASKGVTPAQLALAWVLAQGEDIVPIPGTKRRRYLEDNVAALEVALSAEEVRTLSDALPSDAVYGERFPESGMRSLNL